MKEGDTIEYKDDNGDKLKGKIVLIFTSLCGHKCVHINNFFQTRFVKDVKLIKNN